MQPDELTVEEIRAYLDTQAPPERPPAHVRAYREAAAVLAAIREPERLRPFGEAPAGKAAELLGPDLIPATGAAFNGQVMLAPEVRAATLRDLLATGRVEAALAANPPERHSLLQTHLERYLLGDPPRLDTQDLAGLDASLQVAVWLEDVVPGVPLVTEVTARAGYQRLLAPFETLAGDAVFRGRRRELDRLRRYVGVLSPESALERLQGKLADWVEPERQPVVSISGIGGAGKSSLVARFMLEHTRLPEQERIPFGYLDFARSNLDVGAPAGLSVELVRQLDLQFPRLGLARRFEGLLDAWPPESGETRWLEVERDLAAGRVLADILGTLRSELGPRPYVVILDSFEEVQYRGEERAIPFWDLLSALQRQWPFLRVVVAGRVRVETLRLANRPPRHIELGDLDDEAAGSFLNAQGIHDPQVQQDLIRAFGRLPLSLKLVGSLAARTPGGAAALLAGRNDLFLLTASDEIIQAELYGRFLDQITDERVRRIAHPGLTLRRLNPALILEVLNEPCGLLISTMSEATSLFEELRRESSLVSVDSDDGDLVHRPDLRRVMLKMLLAGAPAVAEQIHRRAADWYEEQPGLRARAEWAYHVLQLGDLDRFHDRRMFGSPLDTLGVSASIQAAIDEFPVQMQLWLATQGLEVPDEVRAQASRDQAHAAVAAQIEDLLPYGPSAVEEATRIFSEAYADLRPDAPIVRSLYRSALGRTDRAASPVFRAGARIAAQRGDDQQALKLIEQGLERATIDGAADLTLGLLRDRAWLYRERPAAEQAQGLALLADHALRHEDLTARLQHQAQSVGGEPGLPDSVDLAALLDLLGQASPHDLWDVLPALGRAVAFATGWSPDEHLFRTSRSFHFENETITTAVESVRRSFSPAVSPFTLADPLAALVRDELSPFRLSVFPDAGCQSALGQVLNAATLDTTGGVRAGQDAESLARALRTVLGETGTGKLLNDVLSSAIQGYGRSEPIDPEARDTLKFAAQAGFLTAFFTLCEIWPYRILSVAAPQGRRGEQLTIE
jgi:hypothetical protein